MSNNQNQPSNKDSQSQESQPTQKTSVDEGQKRSAPEHPPAAPLTQRSNSANFGEDNTKDTTKF
jgi:hypothetical protein